MNYIHTKSREIYTRDAIHTSNRIISFLQNSGIDVSLFRFIDHICYRCISQDNYGNMKQQLSKYAILLDESLIGAREVSIWKLINPFIVLWGIIPCIELSAPKLDNTHPEWWEHIEIVLDDLDSFYSQYKQFITETKWFTKTKNLDIEIEFPHTRIWGQLAVKFHEDSIENIIYQE